MALQIAKPKGLARDQRGVFDRLSSVVNNSNADGLYNELPVSMRGRLISVDVARLLSPEFQTWDSKVRHTTSTGSPAGAYAHDRVLRELGKPRAGAKRIVITAGGAGSGKTSLLDLSGSKIDADLIFDNQLRDFSRAKAIFNAVVSNGWEAEFMYVHRPFNDVVRAVIERSQRTGRWNHLAELPQMHIDAQATIVRIRRMGLGTERVKFRAQYNASQGVAGPQRGSRVFFRDLKNGGPYHLRYAKALLRKIPEILADTIRKGIICKELAALIGKGLPTET